MTEDPEQFKLTKITKIGTISRYFAIFRIKNRIFFKFSISKQDKHSRTYELIWDYTENLSTTTYNYDHWAYYKNINLSVFNWLTD